MSEAQATGGPEREGGSPPKAGERTERDALSAPQRVLWIALLAVGCFLRVYDVGRPSLNYDEGASLYLSSRPVAAIPQTILTAHEMHPPLPLLLQHWVASFRYPETWLRSVSVAFACLLLPLTWSVARRVGGKSTAFSALALSAVSGNSIFFSHTLRFFMQAAFLFLAGNACMIALFDAEDAAARRQPAVLLALVASAAIYTHYYGFLIIFFWVFYTALWQRRCLRPVGFALGAALLSFLPWLSYVRAQSAFAMSILTGALTWKELPRAIFHMALTPAAAVPSSVFYAAVAAATALALIGARRCRYGGFLLGTVFFPVAVGMIGVFLGKRVFYAHLAILFTPTFLILMAGGLNRLIGLWRIIAVIGIVVGQLFLYRCYETDPSLGVQDNRGAIARVSEQATSDEGVLIPRSMDLPVFLYYYRGKAPWKVLDPHDETRARLDTELAPFKGIWIVFYPTETRPPAAAMPPSFRLDSTQATRVREAADMVVVEHYVRKPSAR